MPAFLGLHPRHRRADRALHHPAPGPGAAVGLAARQAAAAARRNRRRRHRRRPDQGHDGQRQGAHRARASASSSPAATRSPIILTVALWFVGFYLRPDYWWNLPNTFAILLNFTEVALLTIGLTYVIACGDIDLSVGAVLALAGSTAAYCLKVLGVDPVTAVAHGHARRRQRRGGQRPADRRLRAAGLHRDARHVLHRPRARGLDRRRPAAHRLSRKDSTCSGARSSTSSTISAVQLPDGHRCAPSPRPSACRRSGWSSSPSSPASFSATRRSASKIYATGGNLRAADYAGINTGRVRFLSLSFAGICAAMAGIINVAYFRSFNPVAGQFRELDAIASVIIGGGSIFGGYGTDHRLAGRRRGDHADPRAAAAQHHHRRTAARSCCRSTGSTSSSG